MCRSGARKISIRSRSLAGSGRVVTGLDPAAGGLRHGSTPRKSTLHAVIAGQDDHAAGDGRVSHQRVARADAGERGLFGRMPASSSRLPPGVGGDLGGSARGAIACHGSRSRPRSARAPLLILMKTATNLLVPAAPGRRGDAACNPAATRREALGRRLLLPCRSMCHRPGGPIMRLSDHDRAPDRREFLAFDHYSPVCGAPAEGGDAVRTSYEGTVTRKSRI